MKKSVVAVTSAMLILGGSMAGYADAGQAAEPKVLRMNMNSNPPTVDPGIAEDSTSGAVTRAIFEGLTRVGKDGKIHEAAAESYTISADGKTYTFKIRPSKWSNGDPVTAHDFEYAWKRALNPKTASNYAYQLYYLKGAEAYNQGNGKAEEVGVKAIDATTLVVELTSPTPFFTELTAFYTYYPVNKKVVEANKHWANDPKTIVSNGPFQIETWKPEQQLVLTKNQNYWDKASVKLDKIHFSMIEDELVELTMFRNGDLDWAGAPLSQIPLDLELDLESPPILNTQAIAGTYFYRFNTKQAPFNNVKIRKAFAYALDRQGLIEAMWMNVLPATGYVPSSMGLKAEGYFKDNDIETAKQLLQEGMKEAGISKLPPITISYNTSQSHKKIAEVIQYQWKNNLGVEVKLENTEWKKFLEDVHQSKYQISRFGWLADFNDPINFLEMFKDKDGGNNDTGWENPQYKELLNQSAKEQDPKKRKAILAKAEQILMDEMPIMPIYYYSQNWLQSKKVDGVVMDGLGMIDFKYADIKP
ncbi:peptide ABC transporter substrate-binding protein [Brevibacillus parabrevis]|uniref:peptide ABC transporter substrate-binding protein n=1 Tax=Brevibacillus parabrevis TaxID=54914 RepID=UPI002E1F4664|nr:peptide ABC transporter substrate-binding protein [Brevibacillus parabrevis]